MKMCCLLQRCGTTKLMSDFTKKDEGMAAQKQTFGGSNHMKTNTMPVHENVGRSADETIADMHLSWQQLSHKLKIDLGEAKWKAWIKPLVFQSIDDGILTLRAESSFLRNRVLTNYSEKLKLLAKIK